MDIISFKNWEGTYALFEIQKDHMPNNQFIDKIIISHQGDWISEDAMLCHPQYAKYEDVQFDMGEGLQFLRKWFSPEKGKSYFEYKIIKDKSLLAVPATGEEITFEVYGKGEDGQEILLLQREL